MFNFAQTSFVKIKRYSTLPSVRFVLDELHIFFPHRQHHCYTKGYQSLNITSYLRLSDQFFEIQSLNLNINFGIVIFVAV